MSIAKTKASYGRDYSVMEPENLYIKYKFKEEIRRARLAFKKSYLQSWSEKIFTVTKKIRRRSPVYKIADYHGEELQGTFYEQELQSIIKKTLTFIE